jgi:hypothetical protein
MLDETLNDRVEQAIQQALLLCEEPVYIGNEPVFRLCVELRRFLPKNPDIPLRPVLERFYELSDGTLVDDFGELLTLEDAWDQFLDAWPKVSYPGIVQEAKERANQSVEYRPELAHLDPQRRYLATVCYEMQQIVGTDANIYLSSYDAAELLGFTDHKKALRTLKRFCAEGILQFVKQGNFKNREANEYRYVGHEKPKRKPDEIKARIEDQKRRLRET